MKKRDRFIAILNKYEIVVLTILFACFHFLLLLSVYIIFTPPGGVKGEPIPHYKYAYIGGISKMILESPVLLVEDKIIQSPLLREWYDKIGFLLLPLNSLLWGFALAYVYMFIMRRKHITPAPLPAPDDKAK